MHTTTMSAGPATAAGVDAAHFLSVATAVAAAEGQQRAAQQALAAAQAETARRRGRLAALEQRRGEIVARRTAGDQRDGDGADLALIGADVEGLAVLIAEAEAEEAGLRPVADAAAAALSAARFALSRDRAEREEQAMVTVLTELDTAMLEAVTRLEALHLRLGRGRPVWGASRELRAALQRLAFRRADP